MATPRLLIVLLLVGAGVLLVLQNTAPALPLVFLGIRTPAYPLAFWLVSAIALGALSSVFLASLVSGGIPSLGRGRRTPSRTGRRIEDPNTVADFKGSTQPRSTAAEAGRRREPAANGEWGEWTNLSSPSQWEDWSQAEQAAGSRPQDKGPRWGRKRAAEQAQKVDESWQELSGGWNDLENVRYKPKGVSPVADALDELDEGWEDYPDVPPRDRAPDPRQDFEADQSPKRVYRDGSIYSYSYRDSDAPQGRTDSIYGPEDEEDEDWQPPSDRQGLEWSDEQGYEDDYEEENFEPDDPLRDPRLGPDGVVDAEYRVIVPPYRPLEKTDDDEDEDWIDGPSKP